MCYVHLELSDTDNHSYSCADRDMFMRYLGGGIGHHSTTTLSEWRDVEDVDDDMEMPDAANEGTTSIDHPLDDFEHPNEDDYTLDEVVSNELDVQQDELDDYEYTKESELEEDLEDEETLDRDDGDDDFGQEYGEDYEGIGSDVEHGYDN